MWPRIGAVPTYAILYGLGIVVHFFVSRRLARHLGLERRVWILVSIAYCLGMTLGAKALYDLRQSDLDLLNLLDPRHYMKGGLWGGLAVYLVLAVPLSMLLTVKRRSACDLVALAIPISYALAKVGCLLQGCCYGRPSSVPWAIAFPDRSAARPTGIPLHPTQLYEIAVLCCIYVVFKALKHDRWRGTRLPWFVAICGVGRAAIDAFRGDADRYLYIGPITLTQLACLAAAILSAFLLILWTRRTRQSGAASSSSS